MKILSNKRYDELIQAKQELDTLHRLFILRNNCVKYASKEANKLGIPFGSFSNSIYAIMERYFNETVGKIK